MLEGIVKPRTDTSTLYLVATSLMARTIVDRESKTWDLSWRRGR